MIAEPPGVLFLSLAQNPAIRPDTAAAMSVVGADGGHLPERARRWTAAWGSWPDWSRDHAGAWMLACGMRRHEREPEPAEVVHALLDRDGSSLAEMLPPFGAVVTDGRQRILATTDALGLRHIYHRQGDGWAAASTSARVIAALRRPDVEPEAIAVQSLLGWLVGTLTPFVDVEKLAPGAILTMENGQCTTQVSEPQLSVPAYVAGRAPVAAAHLLREWVSAYLDDHPDAVLQLTGGQDSRILLGAIPPSRRADVEVMTLSVPGSADASIAADLAGRYGMTHRIATLGGLEELTPDEAHERCRRASESLDCSADPVAHAVLTFAEEKMEWRPRLSGLGGEFARGFYYFGPTRSVPVTRGRVRRLAGWRMFANEPVPTDALEPDFALWARDVTLEVLYQRFAEASDDWLAAGDEFYLGQRMQRWAGVLLTATCLDRPIVNPMLDDRFLGLARTLPPAAKKNARFLSRIMVELDPELASVPMDGRPAPLMFAQPGVGAHLAVATTVATKARDKVRQRLSGALRPPVGAELMAAKVLACWRARPELLEGVGRMGVFRGQWLGQMLEGQVEASPSAVALLLNLETACDLRAHSESPRSS